MKLPYFTIGHSDRSLPGFVDLLAASQVACLADVRKLPRSRSNPQFNEDTLPSALAAAGIAYEHLAALGGLRGKHADVPPALNAYWTNRSFHNYADHALSTEFRAALEHLLAKGRMGRCAIMCSEAVWWRCHRRIITDYMIAAGETVEHIMGHGRIERAQLTPGAEVRADGTVVYPAR
jgi:uncharacterized protein (DUF488 family)